MLGKGLERNALKSLDEEANNEPPTPRSKINLLKTS